MNHPQLTNTACDLEEEIFAPKELRQESQHAIEETPTRTVNSQTPLLEQTKILRQDPRHLIEEIPLVAMSPESPVSEQTEEIQLEPPHSIEEKLFGTLNPQIPVSEQTEALPYDRRWEFPKKKLILGKALGSGAFGVVVLAEADGILKEGEKTTVAVKRVYSLADTLDLRMMFSELKIMIYLGPHLNVVNLLGACTKNLNERELLVIVEYCRYGSLDKFLWNKRDYFKKFLVNDASGNSVESLYYGKLNYADLSLRSERSSCDSASISLSIQYDSLSCCNSPLAVEHDNTTSPCPASNSVDTPHSTDELHLDISPKDLLCWCFQVAKAMEYLANRKVVHGDLAARNILLHDGNIVKICDFGLSQNMYDKNYIRKSAGRFPLKWMAPESLLGGKFSTESDVWTFGITMWEIYTLAMIPYPEIETREELLQKLFDGHRLDQPPYASKDIYAIMKKCWKKEPSERPTFTQLAEYIGELMEERVRSHLTRMISVYQSTHKRKN